MDKPVKNDANCQTLPLNTNFEEIFYQSPIGILLYDKNGKLTNANNSALNIARIPKLDDVLGTNLFDNPKIDSKKKELHEKGLIKFQDSLDLIKIKKQNIYNPLEPEIIDIDWTVSVTDSGYLVQIQDITNIKKIEKNNRMILDSIGERYAEFDNEWHYVDVNSHTEEIYNMNRNEIIGKALWDVFPQLLGSKQCKMFYKAKMENVPVRFETESVLNGEWFETNAYPHPDGLSVYSHNINDRKIAEETLQEFKKKYRGLFNNKTFGLAYCKTIIDENNKPIDYSFLEINDTYERLTGLKREDVINKRITEILPGFEQSIIDKHNQVALTGNDINFETYEPNLKNWYDVTVYSPQKGYFMSIFTNITERKKAEEKLKESEQKFNNIFYSNPGGMILADAESRCIDINQSFIQLSGYNRDELIGHTFAKLNLFNSEKRFQILKETEEKGSTQSEIELQTKSGEKRIVIVNSQTIEINNEQNYISFIYDITERKQFEIALKKSERSLDEAQHIAHIGSWEWNIPTGIITWSNELYSIYGLDNNNFTPTLSSFGDYVHPDDQEYVNKISEQIITEGKSVNFDFRIILDDGSIRILNTLAEISEFDKNGNPVMVVGINQDITERKEIELELNENIENLARSNKELQQFAYITSHDLREPLRMITSFLQLLERRYNYQLDQDAKEFIGYAVDGAKRLDNMINDLLLYSKITRKEIKHSPLNIEKVLDKALVNLKVSIDETHTIITYDHLPEIIGDEDLMIQLFQNLIQNSIKYRSQETPKICISARQEKNRILFKIKDNGIGISKDHLERIFTIFQRLHTNEQYEGTGIGLAIAQKIVQQHGGKIWAESELGKGTAFYFTIPIN